MASSVSKTMLMLKHAAASFAILCLVLLVGCGAFQEQGGGGARTRCGSTSRPR